MPCMLSMPCDIQELCREGALALQASSVKVEQAVSELVELLLADSESLDALDGEELDLDSTGRGEYM